MCHVSIFRNSHSRNILEDSALNAQSSPLRPKWISCLPESFPELCFHSQPSWLRSLPPKVWRFQMAKWKTKKRTICQTKKKNLEGLSQSASVLGLYGVFSEEICGQRLFVNETDYPLACHVHFCRICYANL